MNNNFRTFVVYAVNQGKVMIIKLWFYYALMHIFDASTKAHSQPCQTSKMERFAKIVDGFKPLIVCTKSSILDF